MAPRSSCWQRNGFFRGTDFGTQILQLVPTSKDLGGRLLQVVGFAYRGCSFTAVTRVQIPSGTRQQSKRLTKVGPFDSAGLRLPAGIPGSAQENCWHDITRSRFSQAQFQNRSDPLREGMSACKTACDACHTADARLCSILPVLNLASKQSEIPLE